MRRIQFNFTLACIASVVHFSIAHAGEKKCPEESKLCPDGRVVSRSGENCDFASCSPEGETLPFVMDVHAQTQAQKNKHSAAKYNHAIHLIMPAYKENETLNQIAQRRDDLRSEIIKRAKEKNIKIELFKYKGGQAGFPDILIKCPDSFYSEIATLSGVGQQSFVENNIELEPLTLP